MNNYFSVIILRQLADSSFRIFVFIIASETQLEGDDASQYDPYQNCMLSTAFDPWNN